MCFLSLLLLQEELMFLKIYFVNHLLTVNNYAHINTQLSAIVQQVFVISVLISFSVLLCTSECCTFETKSDDNRRVVTNIVMRLWVKSHQRKGQIS